MRAISLAMPAGVRMKSTQPEAIALAGMPSYLAELGSWAKVMPASPLMAATPRVPSDAVPERMTADGVASVGDSQRSQESIDGRICSSVRIPVAQVEHPVLDGHFTIGGNDVDVIRRHTHPVCGLQDRAWAVVRASISATLLSRAGSRWSTRT